MELEPTSADVGHRFNVYLNLPNADFKTGAKSPNFVGPLAIFEHFHDLSSQHVIRKTYDVTDLLNELKKSAKYDPSNLSVTIVPKGGIVNGNKRTKPRSGTAVKVKSLHLESED